MANLGKYTLLEQLRSEGCYSQQKWNCVFKEKEDCNGFFEYMLPKLGTHVFFVFSETYPGLMEGTQIGQFDYQRMDVELQKKVIAFYSKIA